MRARPSTRRLARAVPVCGLLCGILAFGTALPGSAHTAAAARSASAAPAVAANPAKQKIWVRTGDSDVEKLVAEIYAAALDGPATDGVVQTVANAKDFSAQGDSATVVIAYDRDLIAAGRQQGPADEKADEKVDDAVPGHGLVGRTRIEDRPVLALNADFAKLLATEGKPVSTVAEFGRAVRERPDKPPILVSPEYGQGFESALVTMGLTPNLANSAGDLDKVVNTPEFPAAVLVPARDRRLVRGGGTPPPGKLLALDDPDPVLPARTLTVLASEQMARLDPEGRRLLDEVTRRLTPEAVDEVRKQAGNGDPAKAARAWARDNVPRREATTSAPPSSGTATGKAAPDDGDSGFSLTTTLLALAVGGALAAALLWTLGWRPAMVGGLGRGPRGGGPGGARPGTRERNRAEAGARLESEAGPTRPYRTPAPAAGGAAPSTAVDGPLVIGPEPRPIAVHLPRQATSSACGLALDGGLLGGLTVRAASVRGRTHSYRGESRQDAYGVRLSGDEQWVIAAVADGLGSARHADVAATMAVRSALEAVDNALRSGGPPHVWDWRPLVTYVSDEIKQATDDLGPVRQGTNTNRIPIARPATTLTLAVLPADGVGTGVCAAVGDSPAIRVCGGRWQPLVGAVHRSGLNDNITTALPGDPGNVEVQTFDWGPADLLILTSDGFAAGVAGGHTPLAQRLAETWRTPPSLTDFVREVDFRLSTFDDDRTVVALWAGRHDTAVK